MYTTASVFFKTLADVGITHAFVNWGSDHSAFLEDLQRQRAASGGKTLVEIVTCPSEYVALSAALGFVQVTGRPTAVIVHVDVGTQVSALHVHGWIRIRGAEARLGRSRAWRAQCTMRTGGRHRC